MKRSATMAPISVISAISVAGCGVFDFDVKSPNEEQNIQNANAAIQSSAAKAKNEADDNLSYNFEIIYNNKTFKCGV